MSDTIQADVGNHFGGLSRILPLTGCPESLLVALRSPPLLGKIRRATGPKAPKPKSKLAVTAKPPMHLGILKVDSVRDEFVEAHGDYPDMFERLLLSADSNLKLSVFDVQADGVPSPDCCDGYLITGSRDSVYDELPWIPPLVEFMAELRRRDIKLAGICFGHQLVAHFFGGKVGPADQGWAVGVHGSEVVRQEPWMSPTLSKLRLLSSHKDQVLELPEDAKLFASNEFCPLAGFTVGDHTMTIQGHPEFNQQYAGELMTFRRELLGSACYEAGVASLSQSTDHQAMGRWLVNFFRATET